LLCKSATYTRRTPCSQPLNVIYRYDRSQAGCGSAWCRRPWPAIRADRHPSRSAGHWGAARGTARWHRIARRWFADESRATDTAPHRSHAEPVCPVRQLPEPIQPEYHDQVPAALAQRCVAAGVRHHRPDDSQTGGRGAARLSLQRCVGRSRPGRKFCGLGGVPVRAGGRRLPRHPKDGAYEVNS